MKTFLYPMALLFTGIFAQDINSLPECEVSAVELHRHPGLHQLCTHPNTYLQGIKNDGFHTLTDGPRHAPHCTPELIPFSAHMSPEHAH